MGVCSTIDAEKFPRQGSHLGKRVAVVFHYDLSRRLKGTVVRDDSEEPGLLIIRLDDGRHVLATECQYSPEGL